MNTLTITCERELSSSQFNLLYYMKFPYREGLPQVFVTVELAKEPRSKGLKWRHLPDRIVVAGKVIKDRNGDFNVAV